MFFVMVLSDFTRLKQFTTRPLSPLKGDIREEERSEELRTQKKQ